MALMILLALSNEARNKNLNAINITNSILKKNIKSGDLKLIGIKTKYYKTKKTTITINKALSVPPF